MSGIVCCPAPRPVRRFLVRPDHNSDMNREEASYSRGNAPRAELRSDGRIAAGHDSWRGTPNRMPLLYSRSSNAGNLHIAALRRHAVLWASLCVIRETGMHPRRPRTLTHIAPLDGPTYSSGEQHTPNSYLRVAYAVPRTARQTEQCSRQSSRISLDAGLESVPSWCGFNFAVIA